MKYINSDFNHERSILGRTPTSKEDAYNKLICLREIETRMAGGAPTCVRRPSKRKNRIFKMYFAFKGEVLE